MITKRDFGTPWVSVTYVLPPVFLPPGGPCCLLLLSFITLVISLIKYYSPGSSVQGMEEDHIAGYILEEDLSSGGFISLPPLFYYSPVPVSLGYIAGLTKALPVATVPEIPAYRKRYYMVRYFRWSGHPPALAVLTKGVPLLPGQALPLPSGGRIQVCFRFAVLHPWPVTLGFGFPSV